MAVRTLVGFLSGFLASGILGCSGGSDNAATGSAGGGGDAGAGSDANPCLEAGDRGEGSTFTDLYRDFFGPTGLASCSAQPICHVPGGSGAQLSHYICSPDQQTCWASMTSSLVPEGGSPTPEMTLLYEVLRKAPPTPGTGPMPRNSAFAFCPDDLQRIKNWISSGAAP